MINFAEGYIEFAQFHQDSTNKLIHAFGVPVSLFGLYGLLFSISHIFILNWFIGLDLIFIVLSWALFCKMHITIGALTIPWTLIVLYGSRLFYWDLSTSSFFLTMIIFSIIMLLGFGAIVFGHKSLEEMNGSAQQVLIRLAVMPLMITAIVARYFEFSKQEFEELDRTVKQKMTASSANENMIEHYS